MTPDRRGADALKDAGFGIYVHWPYCESICPYCDFNVHLYRSVDESAWIKAFRSEISHHARLLPGRSVDSIFFGGGTPSLMSPEMVHAVIADVANAWTVTPRTEITLEANPTSVESGRFAGYSEAGVNRISIGVQSLIDPDLKKLGRRHTAAMARRAIEIARQHFSSVSIDMIYARQHQSVEAWAGELRNALCSGVDHLSLYQLTIKPGTRFGSLAKRGKLRGLPGEDLEADLLGVTDDLCSRSGFPGYETSSYARPGYASVHNLIYWRYGEFAGIGPGADGRIVYNGSARRTRGIAGPADWLRSTETTGTGVRLVESLPPDALCDEYLIASLRLREGTDLDRYAAIADRKNAVPAYHGLVTDGFLEVDGRRLRATHTGRPLLDSVLGELCPDPPFPGRQDHDRALPDFHGDESFPRTLSADRNSS